jgi:steroid delta-isomerase-like uncharacterized protein
MKNDNIRLVQRLFEEQASQDDISLYDQLFAIDVIVYGPASGQVIKGLSALKKVDKGYHKAYPGAKFELESIFESDNHVIVRWNCRGSYKEGFKGIFPKKNEFSIHGMSQYSIYRGKIQEVRQFWDRLGILEQIGEIQVHPDRVEPGYYADLLKGLGMEKYLEKLSLLTKRERECLECLLRGKTAKETATILGLSPRTVESYIETIKRKLKCSNKGELFSTAETLKKLELI